MHQIHARSARLAALAAAVLLTGAGCQGAIDAMGDDPAPGGGTPSGAAGAGGRSPSVGGGGAEPAVPPPPGAPTGPRAVPAPPIHPMHGAIGVRRLTRFEYGNTIVDLLGVRGAEADIGDDDAVGFLSNNQHAMRVGLADLETYERAANKVSTQAAPSLKLPTGCAAETMAGDCLARFLADFLLRAFRRPPADAELQRYTALYNKQVADGWPRPEALRGMLQAILLSPSFLYRTELGTNGVLGPYEVASRLSYFLWGTMPDAELFARAKENALRTPEQLKAQLGRMLADPRAQRTIQNVVFEWMGLKEAAVAKKGKDVTTGLSTNMQTYIEEETRRFVTDSLLGPGGSYEVLYGARHSFVNDTLATFYGVKGVTGKEFRKADLDPNQRRGLFTQSLLLTAHTKESGYSVVQMGRFVRERMLCQQVPPPPGDVDTALKDTPVNADLPYRKKFEQHATEPTCRGCHQLLDPPGFAYLTYDPVGRYKANDPKNLPFDTAGQLVGVGDAPVPFKNAVQMIDGINVSLEARGCFARKFAEYAFGRTLAKEDIPLYERMVRRIDERSDFTSLLGELVMAKEFVRRGPDESK